MTFKNEVKCVEKIISIIKASTQDNVKIRLVPRVETNNKLLFIFIWTQDSIADILDAITKENLFSVIIKIDFNFIIIKQLISGCIDANPGTGVRIELEIKIPLTGSTYMIKREILDKININYIDLTSIMPNIRSYFLAKHKGESITVKIHPNNQDFAIYGKK